MAIIYKECPVLCFVNDERLTPVINPTACDTQEYEACSVFVIAVIGCPVTEKKLLGKVMGKLYVDTTPVCPHCIIIVLLNTYNYEIFISTCGVIL